MFSNVFVAGFLFFFYKMHLFNFSCGKNTISHGNTSISNHEILSLLLSNEFDAGFIPGKPEVKWKGTFVDA